MTIENTSKITKVDSIRVGLAPPELIKKWAERTLPNGKIVGQVTSSQTVNYKTLKPEKDGLFCERIFGPVKDFECSCGRKKNKTQQQFCPDCNVEFTSARVRRYRLGYIQLVSPVTHVWYLKGRPSYISILLGMRRKEVEAITYCTEPTNISGINFADLYNDEPSSDLESKSFYQTFNDFSVNSDPRTKLNSALESHFEGARLTSEACLPESSIMNQLENDSLQPLVKSNLKTTLETKLLLSQESSKLSLDNLRKITSFQDNQLNNFSKKKQINNYYTVFQNTAWENQEDINTFSYYMSASFGTEDIPIPVYFDRIKDQFMLLNNIYLNPTQFDIPLIGAEAIRFFLKNLDLQALDRQIRVELFDLNETIPEFENENFTFFSEYRDLFSLRAKKLRQLKLVRHFRQTKARPEWMILSVLPVLPPDLRPIIQLDGDQVAVSDLNKLYQKVLFRNNRMKRHKKSNSSNKSDEMKYAQRLLQEAVDALIENGKGGANPICASNDRPLKSLSDMLKGKKGRFRQNLLGKRVDYSGRSVIVVGPKLKLHQCGLPKEMAVELFQPFLIRRLMTTKIVRTIVSAKRLIQRKDPVIWEILQQVLQNHPILLNRAPTLHRLGIQAFQPKLVDGRAILLHPLVCPAFNADFDGDQMAVHVPLSFQARAEAWKLMWSRNNLLSPATGQPILIPSQDMVLGCYYLTTTNSQALHGIGQYFIDLHDVLKAFAKKKIALHTPIWVRWSDRLETGNLIEQPLEIRIDCFGNINNLYLRYQRNFDKVLTEKNKFIRTTAGRVLVNQIILNK
uniref:DNA-directed RNA polymerase subunit beta' n=1 Tax=Koliella longiseta TaxID=33092 RepID=A0A097KLG6_9CHLO|nr:beta' subunit of RNA polymerase [Koliella longiseta]AIT94017.1 beta' subunit of RNA polymerase [Koliella longiseta]